MSGAAITPSAERVAATPGRVETVVTIQYLRGIAASLIVLHHALGFPAVRGWYPVPFAEVGVDLFFVISGYIMWTTTAGAARGPVGFWQARLVRIVPLYWVFTTLYVAMALALPGAVQSAALDFVLIVKSYLFIPAHNAAHGGIQPVYTLGWTLNFEMFFYLVFGLCLLIQPRPLRLCAIVIALGGLVAAGARWPSSGAVWTTYTSPMMLEFLAGVLIGATAPAFKRAPPGLGWALVALGLAWFVIATFGPAAVSRVAAFGGTAVLLVIGALVLEALARQQPSRLALLIGDASYSIYLAHPFPLRVLQLATAGLIAGAGTTALALYVCLAVIVGIVGGVASWWLIERPALAVGRRLLRPRPG